MITFCWPDYVDAVREQTAGLAPPDRDRAICTAMRVLAKHHGLASKYDGKGHLRKGWPAAGDQGGRPQDPYIVGQKFGFNIR